VNQLFDRAFVDTGAKSPVKIERFLNTAGTNSFTETAAVQPPSAAVAEGRDILFDFAPALDADVFAHAGLVFDALLARGASPGPDYFAETFYQAAQHKFMITTK
jgi:hypothetical protein